MAKILDIGELVMPGTYIQWPFDNLSSRFTYSMSLLKSLLRLPVRYIKICIITYQTLSCKQPLYLLSLITAVQLRSSSSDLLIVPKVNTNTGTWAFAVSTPALWKVLPSNAKSVENIAKFRRYITLTFCLSYFRQSNTS